MREEIDNNLTYFSYSNQGTNAYGETFSGVLNLNDPETPDKRVKLEVSYIDSNYISRSYIKYYEIRTPSKSGTFIGAEDKTYGLGLLERLLIAFFGK
jgi:hypothetical protein